MILRSLPMPRSNIARAGDDNDVTAVDQRSIEVTQRGNHTAGSKSKAKSKKDQRGIHLKCDN
jgi:hypothetical protein